MFKISTPSYGLSSPRDAFLKILVLSGLVGIVFVFSVFNPYLGAFAIVLLLGAIVTGANLRWAVLALVFLLPIDPQFELPGLGFMFFDLSFAVVLWPFAWQIRSGNIRLNRVSLWLLPYVLFAGLTTIGRIHAPHWFWGLSVRLVIAVGFMAVVSCVTNGEQLIRALAFSLVPACSYGVYQLRIQDIGWLSNLLNPHFPDLAWQGRANSFFANWNPFGGFCAVVTVMVLAMAMRSQGRSPRLLYLFLAGLGVLGLLSSGSRGGLLGVGAALFLLLILDRSNRSMRFIFMTAVLGLTVALISLRSLPLARMGELDNFTIEGRLELYGVAVLFFLQHPFIGVGLTNYGQLLPSVLGSNMPTLAAHNTYFQVLAENGTIGFLLFYIPILYLLFKNCRQSRHSTVALASSLGLTAFLVHGFTDYLLGEPQYLLMFAVLFGLASKCMVTPEPGAVSALRTQDTKRPASAGYTF